MTQNNYYPITVGNTWTMTDGFGGQFTSTITKDNGNGEFAMMATSSEIEGSIKNENGNIYAHVDENGNRPLILKADPAIGDTWEVKGKANNMESKTVYTVKQFLQSLKVDEKEFTDVVMVESDAKIVFNGNEMPLMVMQMYYAKNIGNVLTTNSSNAAVSSKLIDYTIK